MKYVCLVYQDEQRLETMSDEELEQCARDCFGFVNELEKSGNHVFSSGLQSARTATTLRRRNGALSVTDGPFAESKEVLGGFTIIEARDLNEAIQLASRFPAANFGTVEVRPAFDCQAEVTDPQDKRIAECFQRIVHAEAVPV
jgi:hypothetical protein